MSEFGRPHSSPAFLPPGTVPADPMPSPGSTSGIPAHVQFANFGERLLASLIDFVFFGLLAVPFGLLLWAVWEEDPGFCSTPRGRIYECNEISNATAVLLVGSILAWFALCVVAEVGFLTRSGQTPGRKALGIMVVRTRDGRPLGVGSALGRTLMGWFVSRMFCSLGYLWHLWDNKKQTWHDKASNSVVIRDGRRNQQMDRRT